MEDPNKVKNEREVDKTAGDVFSWWKKTLVYTTKRQIATWKALILVLFISGVVAGIIWSVALKIETRSKAAGSVFLSWNANTEADLAGYKLYWGTSPRTGTHPSGGYPNSQDIGRVTSYTMNNLTEGRTYYFSVSAYDTSRNESDFSAEVSKLIPVTQTTCASFTYSSWGTCQSNGTQTRTIASSSPSGCTGGTPVLSQACTYAAPTCTDFTYSNWGACQPDNTQTRTVASSSPSGCTGGSPVLTQGCSSSPSLTTCTSFKYSKWSACVNGSRTRTVTSSRPIGCEGGITPLLNQTCRSK